MACGLEVLGVCCVPEQAQRQHVDNLLAILQEGLWQHDYPRVASAAVLALPQLVRCQSWPAAFPGMLWELAWRQ
jgi:hypothetical protein